MQEVGDRGPGDGERRLGVLLVLSGPAASGKSTILKAAVARDENVRFSVSCTTRPPREGEVDGVEYHFLTEEQFATKVEAGEFLEHARVHKNRYGTLRESVVDLLERGIDVVMDIDVQGAEQIRACEDPVIAAARVDVFVMPPTVEELERRLRDRGSENEETFRLRMETAVAEMAHADKFEHQILSGTREEDYAAFAEILEGARLRGGS